MLRICRVVIAMTLVAVAIPAGAAATDSIVLHRVPKKLEVPHFAPAWVDGRYEFVTDRTFGGRLINDRTGRARTVTVPGCIPAALGGGFLLFGCTQSVKLYSLAKRTTREIVPAASVMYSGTCGQPDVETPCSTAVSVGSRWIGFEIGCYHCSGRFTFENIRTGQVIANPSTPGGRTTVDLNSPSLTATLCPPLTIPPATGPNNPGPGVVRRYGHFVLEATRGGAPKFLPVAYLGRCGSARRQVLTRYANEFGTIPIDSDSREIVWATGRGDLAGVYLPSLRPFVVKAGPSLKRYAGQTGTLDLVLTSRPLYVVSADAPTLVMRRP